MRGFTVSARSSTRYFQRYSRKVMLVFSVTLLVASIFTTSVRAQFALRTLEWPVTARSEAMGLGGVADVGDPGNIFRNAAAVNGINGIYAHGAYKLPYPSSSSETWFGHGSVGAGRALGASGMFRVSFDLTYVRLSVGGNDTKEDYIALTGGGAVTFSRDVTLALGIAYKRLSADGYNYPNFADPSPSGYMFDFGSALSKRVAVTDWSVTPGLGLSAVNVGPDLGGSIPLPKWFNYGVSARVESPVVALGSANVPAVSATFNFDGAHGLDEQKPEWRFGSELAFLEVVFLRWGRRIDDELHRPAETWGVALGAPLGSARVTIDYANRSDYYLAPTTDMFGFTFVWNWDEQ